MLWKMVEVIAGRSSDTRSSPRSRCSAVRPASCGTQPRFSSGAASVVYRKHPDCMFARIRKDHFVMEPPNEEQACSPLSVAAHALYENSSPFDLYEPSGQLDIRDAVYTAESDRTVKVAGLGSCRRSATRSSSKAPSGLPEHRAWRHPRPRAHRADRLWLELREKVTERTTAAYGPAAADCLFTMRVYGKNGVLGKGRAAQRHRLA